jgi:uncharacterized protein YybS (DUF2232 family)
VILISHELDNLKFDLFTECSATFETLAGAWLVNMFILVISSVFVALVPHTVTKSLLFYYFLILLCEFLLQFQAGLFFYDIFWVFFTPVMVSVAKSFDAPIKVSVLFSELTLLP